MCAGRIGLLAGGVVGAGVDGTYGPICQGDLAARAVPGRTPATSSEPRPCSVTRRSLRRVVMGCVSVRDLADGFLQQRSAVAVPARWVSRGSTARAPARHLDWLDLGGSGVGGSGVWQDRVPALAGRVGPHPGLDP